MDETIIDTGVLAALPAPSSSARQKSDKVSENTTCVRSDPELYELGFNCKNFDVRKWPVDVGFHLHS